jgi:hypothetical protein
MIKAIKLSALCLVALFITAQGIKAQTVSEFRRMPVKAKAQLVTDSLKVILSLTETQYAKMYTVVLDGIMRAVPVVRGNDGRLSKAQQLKGLLNEEEAKIKTILSQPQFDVYKTKRQNVIAYYKQHIQDEKLVFSVPG